MSTLHRIPVPSFDLHWYDAVPESVTNYILLPGGGGSAKTGVKNQIMVTEYQDNDKTQIQFRESCFTDTETSASLCSGVSTGNLSKNSQGQEVSIACALNDKICTIYKLVHDNRQKKNKKQEGPQFDKICEFQADFAEEEPLLNTSIVTSTGCIVTGGDDKIIRVWALKEKSNTNKNNDSNEDAESFPYQAIKMYELKKHQATISALHEHTTKPWIVASGKDGLTTIWDFETGKLLVDIPAVLEGMVDTKTNVAVTKVECRGCCFSSSRENILYTMQSPKRGATFIIMWELINAVTNAADETVANKDQTATKTPPRITELSVRFLKKCKVATVPCTRLRISDDGQYLAIGCSDGSVSILDSQTLAVQKRFVHHDLPVTGLAFAPHRVLVSERGERTLALLASCSADNKLVVMRLQKGSFWVSVLLFLIMIAVLVGFFFFSADIAQLLRVY